MPKGINTLEPGVPMGTDEAEWHRPKALYPAIWSTWVRADRKSVVSGKSVDLGGRRIIEEGGQARYVTMVSEPGPPPAIP